MQVTATLENFQKEMVTNSIRQERNELRQYYMKILERYERLGQNEDIIFYLAKLKDLEGPAPTVVAPTQDAMSLSTSSDDDSEDSDDHDNPIIGDGDNNSSFISS